MISGEIVIRRLLVRRGKGLMGRGGVALAATKTWFLHKARSDTTRRTGSAPRIDRLGGREEIAQVFTRMWRGCGSLVVLGLLACGLASAQEIHTWTAAESQPSRPRAAQPLVIPRDLPGSQVGPVALPPVEPGASQESRCRAIEQLYPALPTLPPCVAIQPGPGGEPLSLATLELMACEQSPLVRQAVADVQSARGAAIQAGAYPNPHLGYQADNIGTADTSGYQGMNFSQTIATGGKLQLARAASEVEVSNAQLTLRRTQAELATQVRTRYFAVLAALERVRVAQAVQELSQNIYRIQIERVKVGEAAAYEPLQLRVLAAQSELTLIQARHDYLGAWRQLAAVLSAPDQPPTAVAGNVEESVPQVCYDALQERLLGQHTNLQIAGNSVLRAQFQLRLAQLTPRVPDLDASGALQKDNTTAPYNTTVNVQLGATIPLWDRNRGNILSAEAALCRARQECRRVRDTLVGQLAEAYARYETNRTTVEYYRTSIIPNQIQAYRGIYQRYEVTPESIPFGDLVAAQDSLVNVINTYVKALGDQWQAVVDLASLLQLGSISELEQAAPAAEPR